MADESSPEDSVAPERYLDELCKSAPRIQPCTQEILKNLTNARIFFYPACEFDWIPLRRFTHLCDTFVYCDYQMTRENFSGAERSLYMKKPEDVGLEISDDIELDGAAVSDLTKVDQEYADDFPNIDQPWGRAIQLTRHIGDQQRRILLLYFRAEGATLYRNLFNKRSVAPRIVCLKQCQDGFGGQNWTTFLRWDGPLGRAVWENRLRPEFVISGYERNADSEDLANDRQGHCFDWPWSRVWQTHSKWQSRGDIPAQLKSYVLGDALPTPAGTPVRYQGAVAGDEQMRPLNNRTVVRLKRPRGCAAIPAGVCQFSLGREDGRTLGTALRQLSVFCAREHIDDAHTIGCHFEDEAAALYAWKWTSRHPKALTIHCETEGDLACYGPAADEIIG